LRHLKDVGLGEIWDIRGRGFGAVHPLEKRTALGSTSAATVYVRV